MTNKKFYEFDLSNEPKIIGVRNGGSQAIYNDKSFDNHADKEKFENVFTYPDYLTRADKFSNIVFPVKRLNLYKTAKITDFITFSPGNLLVQFCISQKVKDIFTSFNVSQHLLFETKLYKNDQDLNETYYFFYLPSLNDSDINYDKCEVYRLGTRFKVKDKEHCDELLSYEAQGFSELSLKTKFDNLDLFQVRSTIYISADLKFALECEKVTGLDNMRQVDVSFNN